MFNLLLGPEAQEDTLNGDDEKMKRKFWVSGIVGVCVVALAVGLGVGLSNGVSSSFHFYQRENTWPELETC